MSKLWGGRFAGETNALVHQYNASIGFDARLYAEDITASIAWAEAIAAIGVITPDERHAITGGLEQVRREFDSGAFAFAAADEDIHSAVERRLTELIGPVAGKLHTGRSRNDQVATDFRLWTMRAIDDLGQAIAAVQEALIASAAQHLHQPMPGYTHLQHAQPVTWGHWALSHVWPLTRDATRWREARARAAVLPLGAAALAGSAFPVDRGALAARLGFAEVAPNSLDAVSDRDFAADFLYCAALTAIHLSRLSEQLILFSTSEFGFVEIDDAFATGSSIMPQKKNPDTLELTRGKSGRLIGNLTGLLATLKGLPSTYDKDLQEDKEPVFDAYDTLALALPVMAGLLKTLRVRPERLANQLEGGLLATELADHLARRGVPFREAHHIVGQAVQRAQELGVSLTELTVADLRGVDDRLDENALAAMSVEAALAARTVVGGTAPDALEAQLAAARRVVQNQ